MLIRLNLVAFLLFTFFMDVHAQSTVKGKIYDAKTDSTIAAVNVFNINTKQSARSDPGGGYSITATEDDQLVFSIVGYRPDTVTVVYSMLLAQHDVTLRNEIITLKNVTVTSSYQGDSLARRNYYDNMYKLPNITGHNTPQYGFGISLSPFSHFSQEAKQKRQLKKRLIKEEEEYYVERSFPKQWVASMTGLRGDSLIRFMMLYRPSYSFCRKSSREQMLIYVSEKLKEFKKPK
jgi:hypothetical protein